jgi:hypothetical protein
VERSFSRSAAADICNAAPFAKSVPGIAGSPIGRVHPPFSQK